MHWALSYNRLPVVQLLVEAQGFDANAKVLFRREEKLQQETNGQQDGSGWTPLMIACSLKDGGDALVDLLLGKDADVNAKS